MDRLTERSEHGFAYIKETRHGLGGRNLIKRASVDDLVNRLAAYEDTGLTPDEIEAMKVELAEAQRYIYGEAEADMKRIADDIDGETDACYPCAICAKNNRECDASDNCFKWRGPQEGANT